MTSLVGTWAARSATSRGAPSTMASGGRNLLSTSRKHSGAGICRRLLFMAFAVRAKFDGAFPTLSRRQDAQSRIHAPHLQIDCVAYARVRLDAKGLPVRR